MPGVPLAASTSVDCESLSKPRKPLERDKAEFLKQVFNGVRIFFKKLFIKICVCLVLCIPCYIHVCI